MNIAEAPAGDVGVNLSGAYVGVAEEFLDHAQVGAMLEQVGREAVPEGVRGDVANDAGTTNTPFHSQPQGHRGERRAALSEEDIGGGFRAD